MMTTIILLICMYPFVFIMYYILKNEAKQKKGLYFGVKLSSEQASDERIKRIIEKYNRNMRCCFLFILLFPIVMLPVPWFSIAITIWMLWLIASMIIFFVPFVVANKELKALKNDKGWGNRTDNTLSAEIKYAGQIRKVHFSQFAIPLALSILTFLVACLQPKEELKEVKLILVGTFAILTGLFYLTAVLMDRQKTKIISLDSDVNIGYARSRKNIWKKLWLAYAWMNAVFTIGVLLSYRFGLHQFAVFLAEMFVYCIAFLIVLLLMIKRLKKVESSYENKMDYNLFEDDDLWIGGLIYYNPKDKHAMVEARVGMGNSVNMARPGGKCLAAFLGIMILGVLLSGVWVIMLEFLPIHLSVKEDTLIAAQIRNDYVIQADKMESLSLLTELPHWSKTSGTNMDNLEKGTFHIPEQGRCQVFLNPQNQLFIKFDVNGTTYYMSGENDEETKEVYDKLAGF